ncbi:hypothetical protein NIES37_17190 [Tolypothrix tenuis PCC 7101]|uniref:PIN domain-containing protein n=1 Tax=Tolypothrix tenuis PCC 7101 TaxID=231146 RepID=A0A1Z4MWE0_9CYAN|nr:MULTISPECIES: PIN domain-containing protein [unclassified Tolypothrix]MBD2240899.1 hypothetical protein [Aulosira sp. FACHB-113]BAY32369.1 hypothetical protein NIES2107_42580 [Nostoc carneum NIES-2107]BAY88482.1 hypothetical protein NIES3275_04570 [Microchaete diplosiphon NIES-3275]BAY97774.1 hypothetical protein NIES37_17190 [Tolypothrix tenuis PCC 7101]BAZ71719.1 hypothetical protein NIES50_02650 [Aulosira laxa NIES-50]
MLRILVDADLILEALMNRYNCVEDVSNLLDVAHPLVQIYITDIGWQRISNYISRLQNSQIAEIVINWLQEKIQICPVDNSILQQARVSPLQDFDSAVELVCVSDRLLHAIVTHKPDNFADAPNKVVIWSMTELWVRANLEMKYMYAGKVI